MTNYNPLTGDLNNMAKSIEQSFKDGLQRGSKKVAKGNPHKGSQGEQYGAKGASGGANHRDQNLPPERKWKA